MSVCLSAESLQAFLLDSLSPDEKATVEVHLATCHNCQDALSKQADDSQFRREYLDGYLPNTGPPALVVMPADEVSTLDVDGTIARQPRKDRPDYLGRYKLQNLIGGGGIGEVWSAFDPQLERSVAIKMVRRDRQAPAKFVKGFLEEGRALASLRHAGIVDVYDSGEHGDQVFIVTELLSGGDLAERLHNAPVTSREAAELIANVALAAHAAHQVGLIHRDIKPANIVLDSNGVPRLSDFGLAITPTELGFKLPGLEGTIPYMSPEQSACQAVLGVASDIYSLGVVFYEMLTGTVPHRGRSIDETRQMIQHQPPIAPRTLNEQIPEALERICLKCLQKVPEERYASADQLAEELRDWLESLRVENLLAISTSERVLGTQRKLEGRRRVVLSLAGTAAFGGSLAFALWPSGTTVLVITNPPGARIVVYPIDQRFGLPDGKRRVEARGKSPVTLNLRPGFYLVVAALDDERFHEVYRTVPELTTAFPDSYRHRKHLKKGNSIEWPEIEIPIHPISTQKLGYFTGDPRFVMGVAGSREIPMHTRSIPPFYLASREATFADSRLIQYVPPSLAGLKDLPPDDHPMRKVWWDDAVTFAEKSGMRLPTEGEYEYAATAGGTRSFPWGNSAGVITDWQFGPAGEPAFDQIDARVPVFGLYSNVPEWTSSPAGHYPREASDKTPAPPTEPGAYIVRGAPPSVVEGTPISAEFAGGPRLRVSKYKKSPAQIGFRCARSVRPRLQAADLESLVKTSGPK